MKIIKILFLLSFLGSLAYADCGANFDPKSIPEIKIDSADKLVSRTVTFELAIKSDQVAKAIQSTPLEQFLPGTKKISGVSGTRVLVGEHFGPNGSRRLVCLNDGNTAAEEVIDNDEGKSFRYKVWNYSIDVAKPIEYGLGEFSAEPLPDGRSKVTWTYSFKLKNDKFPGSFGALGRWLFRQSFLDSDYAEFMDTAVTAMKMNLKASKE